jgi:hypothetical protein
MKFDADIDIDLADRNQLLEHIKHIPAAILRDGTWVRHNTGIYATPIPYNPITGLATVDYAQAEERGYIKLDLLNLHIYNRVQSEEELDILLQQEPPWHRLVERQFTEQLIHLGNQYELLQRMPEPITNMEQLAMFLAVIRPAKRHLAGLPWRQVAETVWQRSEDQYVFRRAHAVAYAHVVAINMLLLHYATT